MSHFGFCPVRHWNACYCCAVDDTTLLRRVTDFFIVNILTNTNDRSNFCVVSVEAITHPLFVYHDWRSEDKDKGSEDMNGSKSGSRKDKDSGSEDGKESKSGSYWCVLPERKWGHYFGDQIKKNAAGRLKRRHHGSQIQTQQ